MGSSFEDQVWYEIRNLRKSMHAANNSLQRLIDVPEKLDDLEDIASKNGKRLDALELAPKIRLTFWQGFGTLLLITSTVINVILTAVYHHG